MYVVSAEAIDDARERKKRKTPKGKGVIASSLYIETKNTRSRRPRAGRFGHHHKKITALLLRIQRDEGCIYILVFDF